MLTQQTTWSQSWEVLCNVIRLKLSSDFIDPMLIVGGSTFIVGSGFFKLLSVHNR